MTSSVSFERVLLPLILPEGPSGGRVSRLSIRKDEMKSNGFGRWRQKIIVHVDGRHSEEVARKLDACGPFKNPGNPERSYFEWTRLTTRRGDDEDIVFELCMLLGGPSDRYDWHIDWKTSEY